MLNKFFFIVCSVLFISCSDNDDIVNQPNVSSNPVLVKKIIVKDGTNNSILNITNFEYNGIKILKSTDKRGYVTMYTYIGDLISNIKVYHSSVLKMEYLFTYENNNLTQSKVLNYDENFGEKRLYTYNSNGTVDFIYYKGDFTTQNTLFKSGTITLQNGEVTSLDIQDFENSITTTISRNYDNKNNPLKNIIGFDKLNIELERVGGSFHNINSSEVVYNNSSYFIDNYVYEYNANDYPIKVVISGSGLDLKVEYYY